MSIPKRICERLHAGMKRFVTIIEQQRARDVSEADTVTLVKDLMSQVFGWDKYDDLTSEFMIRSTYCDLAVKLEEKLVELVEVKAIGISLQERHLKQAVDYAANQGVEWVILTNGVAWQLYNVIFAKPIDKQLVAQMDLTQIDCRREGDQELLYLFTKEGIKKGAHLAWRDHQEATSRFMIAALLLNNDAVIKVLRRELKRVVDVNVNEAEIVATLRDEVIKRDALEGPPAMDAARRVNRKEDRPLRTRAEPNHETSSAEPSPQQAALNPPTTATE